MAEPGLVDVVFPNGERGTVPEGSLSSAISSGAKIDTHTPALDDGGLLGMGAAALLGAGSAATLGATDRAFREGSYVLGGNEFSKEVTTNLRDVRERNPGATMLGEFGGMFVNPEAIGGVGEAAAGAVEARLGEGLLGSAAQSAARLAAESAVMGAQRQMTEDALADHQYNAEAVFSAASKDALLGGALGAPFGALGYGGRKAFGALGEGIMAARKGPASHALLDELAGSEGAGAGLRDQAARSERAIEELRQSGLTREQAVHVVQGAEDAAKARGAALDADASLSAEMRGTDAIRPDGTTGYTMREERIPLSDIDVPPPWDPTKLDPLRAAREAGTELDPIRVGRMSDPDVSKFAKRVAAGERLESPADLQFYQNNADAIERELAGIARGEKPWSIVDGIHRSNVALERGEADILARHEIETKPLRLDDMTGDFATPIDASARPIDVGALRSSAGGAIPPIDAGGLLGAAAGGARPSGPVSGLIHDAVERYAGRFPEEQGNILRKHYADRATRAIDSELAADTRARKLADVGTKAMRGLEDTSNQIHFTERPEQFAKMLDPANYSVARDALTAMGQDARGLIGELQMLPSRSVAPARIGKMLQEFDLVMGHLPAETNAAAFRDAWTSGYRLKQVVGKASGFGKAAHLRTPEENAFAELYERLRVGFEDERAFGAAGTANREWNAAFSDNFGRRQDFGSRFSVSIDQGPGGVPLPELDAGKVKGFLGQIGGAEADQSVKSTEAMIDWMRTRAAKIEQYGELTPAQRTAMAEGRAALNDFEREFKSALTESEAANKIRQAKLDEAGGSMNGLLGVVGDTVSRPVKTIERLARVVQTVEKVENSIRSGLKKALERGSSETAGRVVEKVAPRAKEKVIEEIESIRGLASNPAALEAAAARMVGDLSQYAPKMANEIRLTAMRTLLYLAREAPPASTTENGVFGKPVGRYSDIQIHDWETKRNAAFDARTLTNDLSRGVLNRDAIKAAEFAQPRLFAKMQELAIVELQRMQASGQLDRMSYQDKAAYATLLKVAPDQTWTGPFIAAMQASKAAPPPPTNDASQPADGSQLPRKSGNTKPLAESFMTATAGDEIAAGGTQ